MTSSGGGRTGARVGITSRNPTARSVSPRLVRAGVRGDSGLGAVPHERRYAKTGRVSGSENLPEKRAIVAIMPENLDREESVRLRSRMKLQAKECYHNAKRVIMRLEGYRTATYVEGFAATVLGIAVEHAWVVREGRIIDPTLPEHVEEYFPGIVVDGRDGLETFYLEHGREFSRCPLFHAFGWGGADHSGFREARVKSDRHSRRRE